MNFICGFAVILVVLCIGADGLTCWSCTNQMNSKCAEDSISGDESITMLKMDCSTIFRNQEASCSKTVIKTKNDVVVTRGCISKGEGKISDGDCKKIDVGGGSSTTCLCRDDLCNGAETIGLVPLLTVVSLALVGKTISELF